MKHLIAPWVKVNNKWIIRGIYVANTWITGASHRQETETRHEAGIRTGYFFYFYLDNKKN
ncbi:hypothetical protein [Parapedobacter sp. ISTM3]|uniref:hypothetical protein n=1 Tax=Parapedobacter sp. ISTM3 TaxID=2800130 RepID=UPI001F20AAE0|nr:hypothetical protein [Parapedobacter sp. ISTM3]